MTMARYIDVDELLERVSKKKSEVARERYTEGFNDAIMRVRSMIHSSATADVVPREEVFEEVDKFRIDLMNKFIDLCRGNDYNKLTLLKIGDVVDEMYDRRIAELKKKYTEGE
jgi:hypothetical protein